MWEVRVNFARWFAFIHKYNLYFFDLALYMSYCYLTIIENEPSPKEKSLICHFTKRNWHEFQTFYIRPHSAVHSAQWDLGIMKILHHKNVQEFLLSYKCLWQHKAAWWMTCPKSSCMTHLFLTNPNVKGISLNYRDMWENITGKVEAFHFNTQFYFVCF